MPNEYDICCDEGVSSPVDNDEIEQLCTMVLEEEHIERPCMISITLTTDAHMREINKTWRNVDTPTDVISLECERPDDPTLAPQEPCELGDIILAPSYIERQAQIYGTTPADEFRLLLVHGILHLLGYDHLIEEDARDMETREEALLAKIPCDASLGHVVITRHHEGIDE